MLFVYNFKEKKQNSYIIKNEQNKNIRLKGGTMDFKEVIAGKEYVFLQTNRNIAGRLFMLNVSGSHAYGTNIETSDIFL